MTKKQLAAQAIAQLKQRYPDAQCSLQYKEPYQLLLATRLSAQCTDARVNIVTVPLFEAYPTIESLAAAEYDDVCSIIKSCGLYKTKGRDLIEIAKALVERFDSRLPDTMEDLLTLSGIGRKTANLIMGDVYHKPAVVTDTHCIRICGRIGLTDGDTNPAKVEQQLLKVLPPLESSDFCHRLVLFGRDTCKARTPDCENCVLCEICKYRSKNAK